MMMSWKPMARAAAVAVTAAGLLASPAAVSQVFAASPATAAQAENSWTGKIEKKQMQGGEVYVFTVAGKSYMVTPQEKAAAFEGKTVTITGKLEGNTVTISDIKES